MTTQTAAPASTATAGGDPSAAVHARRWVILALLAGCLALIALDNTIVNVALPRMQEDLHASEGELQWIVDSYSLFFAGSLLIAGSLGDRYGRRLALLFGLSVFGLFSLGAGLAPNTDTLMICRALMGIGGAFIMPPTLSILAQVFRDPGERGQAIAIWAAVAGAAVAVGPVLGGFLLEHFDWHSIFLINPVLVIGAIAVTLAVVPESRNPARPRLDPLGATLSTTGLVSLIYAIIQIPEDGLSLGTVGAGLVGIALLVGFVVWELRAPSPMLDMNFFADSLFSTSVFAVAVIYFALFGAMFFVPQFLQLVRGFSPLASGFGVVPLAAGLLVASLLSTRWAAHVGARTVVVTGLLSVTAGMVVAAFITASTPYVVLGIVLALDGRRPRSRTAAGHQRHHRVGSARRPAPGLQSTTQSVRSAARSASRSSVRSSPRRTTPLSTRRSPGRDPPRRSSPTRRSTRSASRSRPLRSRPVRSRGPLAPRSEQPPASRSPTG